MYPVLPSASSRAHSDAVPLEASSSHRSAGNKRSASMIFRIEHLLPDATDAAENAPERRTVIKDGTAAADSPAGAGSSSSKRPKQPPRCGVYVAQFTRKDTLSETFSTLSVMSSAAGTAAPAEQTSYCRLSNDTLCMTPSLLRKIKLSEDIHSNNALFEMHNGNVRVRVTRDIESDAELVAWFGEETTLLMSIPFLTPLNIQGNSRYTCHLCHLTFETPNPLKIHLALGCGRHPIDILWIRLHYALKAATFGQQFQLPAVAAPAPLDSGAPSTANPTTAATYAPTMSPTPRSALPTASLSPPASSSPSRLSAFRPISSGSTLMTVYSSAPPPLMTITSSTAGVPIVATTSAAAHTVPSAFMHALQASTGLPHHLGPLQSGPGTHPLNAAAQIEAIVSNMGASKQGHLCIYCGKVYSRKYGLKIHIRTHTGFKPLKCKFCLRPFGDPSNLNKHVRLHLQAGVGANAATDAATGAAPNASAQECYKCRLCHKTMARRRDLQRHLESRHGQVAAAQRAQSTQRK